MILYIVSPCSQGIQTECNLKRPVSAGTELKDVLVIPVNILISKPQRHTTTLLIKMNLMAYIRKLTNLSTFYFMVNT